jgi:hypothetical protein
VQHLPYFLQTKIELKHYVDCSEEESGAEAERHADECRRKDSGGAVLQGELRNLGGQFPGLLLKRLLCLPAI